MKQLAIALAVMIAGAALTAEAQYYPRPNPPPHHNPGHPGNGGGHGGGNGGWERDYVTW